MGPFWLLLMGMLAVYLIKSGVLEALLKALQGPGTPLSSVTGAQP